MYGVDAAKIDVCYQACDDRFLEKVSEEKRQLALKKYNLPAQYFISVGSIIERKNLAGICEAIYSLQNNNIHLVVVGKGKSYKEEIEKYIDNKGLKNQIHFLEDSFASHEIFEDLPALYQLSKGLLYPSHMEGFGIPIIEAYSSCIPIVTSNVSSLKEIGDGAAELVNPSDVKAIAQAMQEILEDANKVNLMIEKGIEKLLLFNSKTFARSVMDVYEAVY
jgi:glycosyltransferase involved in cell wall biosynthesis